MIQNIGTSSEGAAGLQPPPPPRKAKLKSTHLIYTIISKVLRDRRMGLNLPLTLDDDYWIGILEKCNNLGRCRFFILN